MKWSFLAAGTLVVLTLVACDRVPATGSADGVAVIDLNVIVKAAGRDGEINERLERARDELNAQLARIASDLEEELRDQREKLGASPEPAEQQQLQEMALRAQRELAEKRQLAQQKAQQFQAEMINEFKRQVQPLAKKVAEKKGAKIIFALDDTLLWFDSAIDITDEVVAAVKANPLPPIQVTAGIARDDAN